MRLHPVQGLQQGAPTSSDASSYVPGTHLRVPQLKLNAACPAAAGLQPQVCQQVAASLQQADSVVTSAMEAYDSGLAEAGEGGGITCCHAPPALRGPHPEPMAALPQASP